ncbi:hypothetical protein ARAM_003456 [Aspergillus rambellii]|uniref:Uncharacterized protein n=1 Tax=Aspergillus rambellii TaxID=308745 RepID=A0A0F8VUD0_9EURO|nr:hypothetical protein ARAM_003456 [Aspergillus rambellii]
MESESLQRQGSARDSKKARKQRESLGSSQISIREPRSYYLVVCGAQNYMDGFIFSDFMGFCMALRDHGVGGDFLSCFPLEQHFAWLRNTFSPPIDVIKFGKLGPNGHKALYTYSRFAYVNRQYWWTQVGVHELLGRVETWIREKQQQAEDGDVVSIILEGHGSRKEGYCIGDRRVHPDVFGNLLAGFKDGVQVNAISGACYSGQFINAIQASNQRSRYFAVACPGDGLALSPTRSISNRIRNSRFSQAFVQSLAKIQLPGVPRRRITWRIKDHEEFMILQTTRNLTPGAKPVEPQFCASQPVDGMTILEELIFRDKVDILYDPCVSSRRRRREWPTTDQAILDLLRSDSPASMTDAAKAIVDVELSKCDTRGGFRPDIHVYDQLFMKSTDWVSILRNLYWRARRQSAVWDVFELLVMRGFIHPSCLTTPVDLQSMTRDTGIVTQLLTCFSAPLHDEDAAHQGDIPLQSTSWDVDIGWLATMIVRSGAELEKLLDTIHTSRFFGECLPEKLEEFKKMYPEGTAKLSLHPREREGRLGADGSIMPQDNTFGFWLPHGLTNDETLGAQICQCKDRFNNIERAFREVEAISKDQLWLEAEQAGFFDQNQRLPGGDNDNPDVTIECDDSNLPYI